MKRIKLLVAAMMITISDASANTDALASDLDDRKNTITTQKERKMAFVNEYISQHDIKKNNLNELFKQYRLKSQWDELDKNYFDYIWTIDKGRKIWLTLAAHVLGTDRHAFEQTGEQVFILNIQGENIEVRLMTSKESTTSFKTVPFMQIWEFMSMTPESLAGYEKKEIIEILKEALAVYGYDGINKQINNDSMHVECRF